MDTASLPAEFVEDYLDEPGVPYRELFVPPEASPSGQYGFFCNLCGCDVGFQECPQHAPLVAPPGLRRLECEATPPHLLFGVDRQDYGEPCWRCQLQPYWDADERARQCTHAAWRRWRATWWAVGRAYRLGLVAAYTQSLSGNGHRMCISGVKVRGRRVYVLGRRRKQGWLW